jgi:NADH:ubiquinone oxidoreductase subunit E
MMSEWRRGTGRLSYLPPGVSLLTITVCVGSSCHVRGARDIIETFYKLIQEHGLAEQIVLQGCFCMDRCSEAVNIKFDDEHVRASSVEEATDLFYQKVTTSA